MYVPHTFFSHHRELVTRRLDERRPTRVDGAPTRPARRRPRRRTS